MNRTGGDYAQWNNPGKGQIKKQMVLFTWNIEKQSKGPGKKIRLSV